MSPPRLRGGTAGVCRPAEDPPACATRLVEMFIEAGIPKGVLNMVTGYGEEAGQPLLEDPRVAAISFTGSSEVGRLIAETCGRNLKRVSLEMGGKNAIIVMNDADLELVLDGATWGGFGTAGQRCTASSRLIVQRQVLGDVQEQLVARAEALKVGDGLQPDIELGPVANNTRYGLSLAIYTHDVNRAFRAINELESGIVYVNAPTIGAEIQLPFGGIKGTGNGHREAGPTAIEEFSEIKSVFVDYSGQLQRAQI